MNECLIVRIIALKGHLLTPFQGLILGNPNYTGRCPVLLLKGFQP